MKYLMTPICLASFLENASVTHQTGDALLQGVVEALNVIGFPGFLRDSFVLCSRNHPL
jgi:hypothetical protein